MSFIPLIVLSLVALAMYGLYFKLAAFVFKRTKLSWGHSFLFAFLLTVVVLGIRANTVIASGHVSGGVVSAVVVVVVLLLGSWYFGNFARTSVGQPLGWAGGLVLTLIALTLLILTGLALIFLNRVIGGL